jgi:DNA helicase-2/ATP-dependent DNA helicase PcrA
LITAAKQFYDEDNDRTLEGFLEQITLTSDVDNWDTESDCVSVMTLHAAKGLEFPVVYLLAVEQGLLPHERSLHKDEDIEEERRLLFVGMTRAMRELNLCHARLRDFRGQALYAVPSMFLDELPKEVEHLDLSNSRHYSRQGRTMPVPVPASPPPTALPRPTSSSPAQSSASAQPSAAETGPAPEYAKGQVVQHSEYGIGQVVEVTGFGVLKRVKIRFAAAGEKTFVADKVKLKLVSRK